MPTATYNLTNNAAFPGTITDLSPGASTSTIQNTINTTASAGNTTRFLAGTYSFTTEVTLPSNAYVVLAANVTINAVSPFSISNRMFSVYGAQSNIYLVGAGDGTSVLTGPRSFISPNPDGGGDCIWISAVNSTSTKPTNIHISGINANNASGDGLYLRWCSNVTVTNCVFNNNGRQGCSLVEGTTAINLTGCSFTNTNGASPMSGIDMEPGTGTGTQASLQNVNVTDCTTSGNYGDGIRFSLINMGSAPNVSIAILRHTSTNNGHMSTTPSNSYNYNALNGNQSTQAQGTITITDSSSSSSAGYGATARNWRNNGAALTFTNLTVTNPNRNGANNTWGDKSAVTCMRGGGNSGSAGNVRFNNTNVTITDGNTDYYFNFRDDSNPPVVNAGFTPGTLTGANAPGGNVGMVQNVGQSSTTVNL